MTDSALEHLADLSSAIRALAVESREARQATDGRINELVRAVSGLSVEVRNFGRSEERLRGQLALVSATVEEHERERTNGPRRT